MDFLLIAAKSEDRKRVARARRVASFAARSFNGSEVFSWFLR
jgi:F0F1-type ATP synthase beta subunit